MSALVSVGVIGFILQFVNSINAANQDMVEVFGASFVKQKHAFITTSQPILKEFCSSLAIVDLNYLG